jgi:hypothetical protein
MDEFIKKNVVLNDDKKIWEKLSLQEKNLFIRMKKDTRSSIRSLNQYYSKVKSIYKKNKKNFVVNNYDFLKDTDTIDKFLEKYKGKKDYYYSILLFLKGFVVKKELLEHYTSKMVESIDKSKKEIRENKKSKHQEENWVKYDEVLKMFRTNKHRLDNEDKLLLSLVILYPRRVQDWKLLRLNKLSSKTKKDINYNYVNINRFGTPTTFDFNRSKSQNYEKLGTNHNIPNVLKKVLREYISKNHLQNGTFFFGENTDDNFSKRIRKCFHTITGKDITSNDWRHIVSTDMENKNYTLNQREMKANQLGHSLIRSLEYAKK